MARLLLLGSPRIETDTGKASDALSRRHPVALLALLAATPSRSVQRSKVAGLLWPDFPEDRARGRLNSCVYRVRRSLGEEAILTKGEALVLNPERVSSDLADFESALERGEPERAVRLHRGPFLEGFHLPGSAPFEHWVDRVRDRIEGRHRGALEGLAGAAEEESDLREAARWWRERARADPYDASVVSRLMRVLAATGNRAEALRVAGVHARLLEEELGVEPSAEIGALAEAIRSGEETGVRGAADGSRPVGARRLRAGGSEGARPEPRAATAVPGSERAEAEGAEDGGSRFRPGHLSLLAAVGVAAILVWLVATGNGGGDVAAREAGAAPPRSIAVLPFDTLGTADASPFAAGLHEDLLTRLASIVELRVVSATSVARFRDSDLPLRAIAESLGVDWVVEGGVQRSGDRIRVHAQLIDPRSDTHAWARSYERELTAENLFRIQADISTAIAGALEARLSLAERERLRQVPTRDLKAYGFYTEGRRLLDQRTASKVERAALLFRRALERDSTFGLAWAGLADAVGVIRSWGYELPEGLPDREAAARRALELDPRLAEAQTSVAGIALERHDLPTAIAHLERAVELGPSYLQARSWLTSAYFHAGRLDDALATMETTRALDLHGFFTSYGAAQLELAAGRYEEALAAIQHAPEPDVPYPVPSVEAWILYHLGRMEDAERMLSDTEGAADRAVLALVRIERGDRVAARRILESLEETSDAAFGVGLVRAGLGDVDGAFEAFDRVEDWGHLRDVVIRYCFPSVLGPVRADARYGALLTRVRRYYGLEPAGPHS